MNKVSDPVVTKSVLKSELDEAFAKNNKIIIDELSGIIDIFATRMYARFIKIERDIADIKNSLDELTRTIDRFVKRLDQVETEQTARDAEVQRMKAWIQQIAKETGVKLEGLS